MVLSPDTSSDPVAQGLGVTDKYRLLDLNALREAAAPAGRAALEDEFASVPSYKIAASEIPSSFSHLNRYRDVLPSKATRVTLQKRHDDPCTEYINANFVSGYNSNSRRFIATQGPLKATIEHFWAMLWEYNVSIVVMMTGLEEAGRVKCERYWPVNGQEMETQDYTMATVDEVDAGDYVVSILRLTEKSSGNTNEIRHFWYTCWPDHGVPRDTGTLLTFVTTIRRLAVNTKVPIVVHCSAGIGRTGTFMAVDIGMDQLQSEWRVCNVYGTLHRMRQERAGSIQTFEQYLFVHQALLDYATPGKPGSMFGKLEPRDVGLVKPPNGSLGMVLRGSGPTFVLKLDPNGVARKNGIKAGDQVLAVNQQDVRSLKHPEVVSRIVRSGDVVTLTVLSKEIL